MAEPTYWESIKTEGGAVLERLKHLVHEGNVRSIRVRQGDRVIAVFPLTAGVVGLVVAPALAAVATLLALLGECTIDIEREDKGQGQAKDGPAGSGEDRVAVWRKVARARQQTAGALTFIKPALRAVEGGLARR